MDKLVVLSDLSAAREGQCRFNSQSKNLQKKGKEAIHPEIADS